MRVLIVGCGYVGLPLGAELVRQGHEVFGLRRGATGASALRAAGIHPLYADIAQPGDLTRLPGGFEWVINCVASGGGTVEDYQRTYLSGTRNVLEWLGRAPSLRYVYTSSTSVYGQNDASWVAENDPVTTATAKANVLVATENLLLNAAVDQRLPATILRLAGIYGPDRGYWLRQFLRNEAKLEGGGDRFLNMIHRDDVVGAIIAALEKGHPGVFNAADDEPVTQLAMFQWLAHRLGKSLPSSEPEPASESRGRGVTNKRVSNLKLKTQLGYQFKYPTFRQGYEAEIVRLGNAGSGSHPSAGT